MYVHHPSSSSHYNYTWLVIQILASPDNLVLCYIEPWDRTPAPTHHCFATTDQSRLNFSSDRHSEGLKIGLNSTSSSAGTGSESWFANYGTVVGVDVWYMNGGRWDNNNNKFHWRFEPSTPCLLWLEFSSRTISRILQPAEAATFDQQETSCVISYLADWMGVPERRL